MYEATLYKKLVTSEKAVQCQVCSHYCKIPENQTGICGVRENINGKLYLLTYGNLIAISVDPIEKKPLYHFKPGTEILSIATFGCNFRCSFCQNWDISQFPSLKSAEVGRETTSKLIQSIGESFTPKEIVAYCKKLNLSSIAYTYNEPVINFEYYLDTMKFAKKEKIANVWVSNGYISKESLKEILPYLDAINVDLKAFKEEFYKKHCKAKLQVVKDNIEALYRAGVHIEVTTLIIPDENDSESEIHDIATFIYNLSPEIPLHLSRFFPAYRMMDKDMTPFETLLKGKEICEKVGLKYVHVGNI